MTNNSLKAMGVLQNLSLAFSSYEPYPNKIQAYVEARVFFTKYESKKGYQMTDNSKLIERLQKQVDITDIEAAIIPNLDMDDSEVYLLLKETITALQAAQIDRERMVAAMGALLASPKGVVPYEAEYFYSTRNGRFNQKY